MDAKQPKPPEEAKDGENLESTGGDGDSLEGSANGSDANVTDATKKEGDAVPTQSQKKGFKQKLQKFNIYLLMFIFVLVIAGGIVLVGYYQGQKASSNAQLKTSTLNQNTLNQLANSDATIGNTSEVLNVESSAVFAGNVLVRNDLQVAGSISIGGTVALTNLAVTGSTSLGALSVSKNLALTGNASIQGGVTIAQSLQVNGSGTFSGSLSTPQLTTTNFQLNGDLNLTHHITAGGPTPDHSAGSAVGGGGTTTVGGSDTSGSITVNTGSNPTSGCFITVLFAQPFNATPHVIVTPIGLAAGGLDWYVTRTSTQFSVCDASNPPSGSSFGFDYFVLD